MRKIAFLLLACVLVASTILTAEVICPTPTYCYQHCAARAENIYNACCGEDGCSEAQEESCNTRASEYYYFCTWDCDHPTWCVPAV